MFQLDGGVRNDLVGMHWGLIPSWAKDPSIGNRMINARAETAREKPSFRKAWSERRCLLPARGFFEWKRTDQGKRPCFIHRADGDLLALAGLWETWTAADGTPLESTTILTTAPNGLMQGVHDRMPVIIAPGDWSDWLDDGEDGASSDRVMALACPAPDDVLAVHEVSRLVNNPANDDPRCLERVSAA